MMGFCSMHILRAQNLVKVYQQGSAINEVLSGVTYSFDAQHSYAITGVSGTGKSTLMHLLSGIDQPTSGQVFYDEKSLYDMLPEEKDQFLNKKVGLVFQDPHLIKELAVVENVMLKGLISQQSYEEGKKEALALLELIGLADKADAHPLSLSGGQQQRVAILRALFNKPQFLLADEPTGNLDLDSAKIVIDLLEKGKEWGMGLVVSSHDPYVAKRMEKKLVLKQGKLFK